MPHPFEFTLKEYKFAIDHLVRTVPEEVKTEAEQMYEALAANPSSTQEAILEALVKTGKAEYAHRHAYQELLKTAGTAKRVEIVLEHVDESVRERLKELLETGATLDEIVKSRLFEERFNADERYQIQDGILDADEHMKEEMGDVVEANRDTYDKLVKKAEAEMELIQTEIDKLKALAARDPKWKDDILNKVAHLEEGWAVTNKDPDLETVKKEIEYWRGTLGDDV